MAIICILKTIKKILVDEQPGTMEYVKKFNTKEEAQKAADILGWKVQEVE